jgi:hypothetical protein
MSDPSYVVSDDKPDAAPWGLCIAAAFLIGAATVAVLSLTAENNRLEREARQAEVQSLRETIARLESEVRP